jgi:protein-S-isoprenylcysteine O-methyltransferase Ste14
MALELATIRAVTDALGATRFDLFGWSLGAAVAVGIRFEERDLRRTFGAAYDVYAERVPALLPRLPFTTGARSV